jgi:hypothetical protein
MRLCAPLAYAALLVALTSARRDEEQNVLLQAALDVRPPRTAHAPVPPVLGARAQSPLLPIPAPEEQVTASSVQPPMLIFVMDGCSGSSTTGHMLRDLIKCTSGWEYYDSKHGEAFKKEKNPWFQKLQGAHPDWNTTHLWRETLGEWIDDVRSRNQTFYVDANSYSSVLRDPELADLVRDIPIVPAWRANSIDRTICMVKDCMVCTDAPCRNASAAPIGHPTYKGERSDLCFQRRRELNEEEQIDYKVWLDVDGPLQDYLDGSKQGAPLSSVAGKKLPPGVTYEKLMQVEYPDSDTTGEFEDGVREWMTMLNGLQVPDVTAERVATCLQPSVGTWHRPWSHRDELENFDEVRDSLCGREGNAEQCAMLRAFPGRLLKSGPA